MHLHDADICRSQGPPGAVPLDAPEQLSESAPAAGWQQASATWGLRHSGVAPQQVAPDLSARAESNASSIFRAPSLPPAVPLPPLGAAPKPVEPALPVPPPVSQQYINDNAKAKAVIDQIIQMHNAQEQQLEQQRQYQQQAILHNQAESLRQLADQLAKLAQQTEMELKELHQLNKTALLEHGNLNQTRVLAIRLQIQQSKVELLRQELAQVLSGGAPKTVATLLITEQPLPQVVFKGKVVEDPYVVHLITAAHQDVQSFGKVKANMVSEDHNWKAVAAVENDLAAMDAFQRIALFHNVKINVSTRMSPVHLKFAMQVVNSKNQPVTVESPISYPLIVITNESQWCDAAGKLILADAFAGQLEVAWPQFANAIHHHFLKATRQDPARPSRGLNEADWTYIHSKFFSTFF